LAVAERERLRAIAANRACRTAAVVAGVTAAVALAWDVTRGRVPSTSVPYHFTFGDGLGRTWSTFEQSIAWFGDFEVRDVAAVVIFAVAWAALLVVAFRRGVARERVVLAGIVVVATVFPIFVSMAHPPPLYTTWQGRYGLPLWVGVPIVAATIAGAPRSG